MSANHDLAKTRQYIRLFEMQLHGVLKDMAKPAETLSGQFSEALLNLYSIREHLDNEDINKKELSDITEKLISQMFECVSSMQFVDSKRQRIEHVADGLSYLIDKDSGNNFIVQDWDELEGKIKMQYKMDKERNIYEKYLHELSCIEDVGSKLSTFTN